MPAQDRNPTEEQPPEKRRGQNTNQHPSAIKICRVSVVNQRMPQFARGIQTSLASSIKTFVEHAHEEGWMDSIGNTLTGILVS